MSDSNFCHNCGRPLEAGARFCEGCGRPVQQSNTVPEQPVYYGQQKYNQPGAQTQPIPAGSKPKRKKNIGASIVIILIGLVLILIAVRLPLLSVFGTKTAGQVVDIEKVIDSNTSSMDYTYRVKYVFTDDDGKSIESSFEIPKAYDFSQVPREGTVISIQYLPAWSKLSVPTDYNNSPLGTIVMILLGIGLIILGATGKVSLSRTRYRR